jgi:hypothetical protein
MRILFVKERFEPIDRLARCNKRKGYRIDSRYPLLERLVPRDRIELPTRGFSDQTFENLKIL